MLQVSQGVSQDNGTQVTWGPWAIGHGLCSTLQFDLVVVWNTGE